MKLTNNQKLFIECLNSNSDKILYKSWLTRGERQTGYSLVRRGLISLNMACTAFLLN